MPRSRLLPAALVACLPFILPPPVAGVAADPTANLRIAATAASRRAGEGWRLTWQVAVNNDGPAPAAGVVFEAIAEETLRRRLGGLRIAGDAGVSCDVRAMACRLGKLPAGDARRFRIEATLAGGTDRRSAGLEFRVAAATADAAPCDNRYYSTTFLD